MYSPSVDVEVKRLVRGTCLSPSMHVLGAIRTGKLTRAESAVPTRFLESFAEALDPDDTTTRLHLLTAFQRNSSGRHRGKERQK